jgi:hypothetical protein
MRSTICALLLTPSACVLDIFLDGGDDVHIAEEAPAQDEWRTAIDAALAPDVTTMEIGGPELDGNFANRGDVEILFDGAEGRIVIEMRRFAFAPDEAGAAELFGRLHAWAYAGEELRAPDPGMAEHACDGTWTEGCQLRVWYEGQAQPHLSGSDLRVRLPPSYLGDVVVRTEDLTAEDDYPLRGDVSIVGLSGSAEIEVEQGRVEVELAQDVLPAPSCGEDGNATCAAYSDEEGLSPWNLECGCDEFGRVHVRGVAADVTVDLPAELWAHVGLQNGHADGASPRCEVEAACEDFAACELTFFDPDKPDDVRAEMNDPGSSALEGAGYQIWVRDDACQTVSVADDPEDYGAPRVEQRGHLKVCSGCLRSP